MESLANLVERLGCYEVLVEENLIAVVVNLSLLCVDLCKTNTLLGATQLAHVRNNLYLCDNLASLNHVASLLVDVGNDT